MLVYSGLNSRFIRCLTSAMLSPSLWKQLPRYTNEWTFSIWIPSRETWGLSSSLALRLLFCTALSASEPVRDRVSKTKEEEITEMGFKHVCPDCARDFPTKRGLGVHQGRWCDGGRTIRNSPFQDPFFEPSKTKIYIRNILNARKKS